MSASSERSAQGESAGVVSEPVATSTQGPGWRAQAGIGIGLAILAVVLWFDVYRLPAAQAVGVGPGAAMKLVSLLLVVLAIAHAVSAIKAYRAGIVAGPPLMSPDKVNAAALGWVMGGLVGLILVLQFGGGFIIGSAWLFAATAKGFGQPLRIKSPLIGLVLALLVYAFFTKALSLSLPAGPIEHLLFG
ncbi:tripartite tricarboxylate transporter TctB family protein [soil metagenome]